MQWESHTRPAPSEFPQGLIAARVGGRSGAMYQAFPFFVYTAGHAYNTMTLLFFGSKVMIFMQANVYSAVARGDGTL